MNEEKIKELEIRIKRLEDYLEITVKALAVLVEEFKEEGYLK